MLRRALRGRPPIRGSSVRSRRRCGRKRSSTRRKRWCGRCCERHPRDAGAYRNLAAIEADRGQVPAGRVGAEQRAQAGPQGCRNPQQPGAVRDASETTSWRRGPTSSRPPARSGASRPAWANLGGARARVSRLRRGRAGLREGGRARSGARWETRLARGWALEGLQARGSASRVREGAGAQPGQEEALYGKALALKARATCGRARGLPGVHGDSTAAVSRRRRWSSRPSICGGQAPAGIRREATPRGAAAPHDVQGAQEGEAPPARQKPHAERRAGRVG